MTIRELTQELQEILNYRSQEIDLAIKLFKESQKGRNPDMKDVQEKLTIALNLLEDIRPAISFIQDNQAFAKKIAKKLL